MQLYSAGDTVVGHVVCSIGMRIGASAARSSAGDSGYARGGI